MSIFAGVLSLDQSAPIDPASVTPLALALSRDARDSAQVYSGAYCAIAFVELGIYRGPSHQIDEDGTFTLLAGTPVLKRPEPGDRAADLAALHRALARDEHSILNDATGVSCGIHFQPRRQRVTLWTDKLGARPVYFCRVGRLLYFSTALRVLEAGSACARELDWRGLGETIAFGYALGNRTAYRGVELIAPGTIMFASPSVLESARYFDWAGIAGTEDPDEDFSRALHGTFVSGVRRRLGASTRGVALLSGGLDSRCVLAAMHETGAAVDTIAFGPPASADVIYARELAARFATRHFEYRRGPFEFVPRLAAAFATWRFVCEARHEGTPDSVWWGHGGNETIGLVSINERIAALCADDRIDEAIAEYLRRERVGIPWRILRPEYRAAVLEAPHAGVREAIESIGHPDPLRRFQIFLLLTEARRKAHEHLEAIDLWRFELAMPFLDADFVAMVLRLRTATLLRHEFYHRWLAEFPRTVVDVPWQVYPGHAPCPLPQSEHAIDQHDRARHCRDERDGEIREQIGEIDALLEDPAFPDRVLDRRVLRYARWMTRLRLRDYDYQFRPARVLARHAQVVSVGDPRSPQAVAAAGRIRVSTPRSWARAYGAPA